LEELNRRGENRTNAMRLATQCRILFSKFPVTSRRKRLPETSRAMPTACGSKRWRDRPGNQSSPRARPSLGKGIPTGLEPKRNRLDSEILERRWGG